MPSGGHDPAFCNADGPVRFFPGPDFASGWGLLNAQAAVVAVSDRQIGQWQLARTGDSFTVSFDVPRGSAPVRVTLAWDDPPPVVAAIPPDSTTPKLVNDLDLELIAPDGQTRHFPFSLNQSFYTQDGTRELSTEEQVPGTLLTVKTHLTPRIDPTVITANGVDYVNHDIPLRPAVRGRDHLNNVEQVLVENDQAVSGKWTAKVTAFSLDATKGPQRFSLIGPWNRKDTDPPLIRVNPIIDLAANLEDGLDTSNLIEVCAVSAVDFRDPAPVLTMEAPPGRLSVGSTIVKFRARDAWGNESTADVSVRVSAPR